MNSIRPGLFALIGAAGLSLAGAMVQPAAAQDKVLDWQDMRDWSVTCNANRYCIGLTTGKSKDGNRLSFKLERSKKDYARIYVTVNPKNQKLELGDHVDVDITGHDYHFFGDVKKVYKGNEMAFAEKATNKSITKLREGRFATITVKSKAGLTVKYDVSLQGVSSVLAMMDVVQGRLDREDAAVVTGGEGASLPSHYDLSAGKAPPAPAADEKDEQQKDPEEDIVYPDEDEQPAQNTANSNAGSDNSEEIEDSGIGSAFYIYNVKELPDEVQMPGYRMLGCDFPNVVQGYGARSVSVEPGVAFYFVPCQGGDVNVAHYVALEVSGSVHILDFQEGASETGDRVSLVSNPAWDAEKELLSVIEYHSPQSDCGKHEWHNMAWDERVLYLSEFRLKSTCDGKFTPPESWPVEWDGEGG